MTLNPYESPQTIDVPLPVASIVDALPPRPALLPCLQAMAEAGRMLMLAALFLPAAILLILLYQMLRQGGEWQSFQVLIMTLWASSLVLCLYGFFKNLYGCTKICSALPAGDELLNLYGTCQVHGWLRVLAVVLVFLGLPAMRHPLNEEFLWGIGAIIWLMLLHPAWLHGRALRWWSARLGSEVAPEARQWYLVSAVVGVTLLLFGTLPTFQHRLYLSPLVICVALFSLAGTYGAYARMYGQLIKQIVTDNYETQLRRAKEES